MSTVFKILFLIIIVIDCTISVKKKKTKRNNSDDSIENDILEKSEVVLKFPTYAMKMPPIITSRRRTSSKVDPLPGKNSQFIPKQFKKSSFSELFIEKCDEIFDWIAEKS